MFMCLIPTVGLLFVLLGNSGSDNALGRETIDYFKSSMRDVHFRLLESENWMLRPPVSRTDILASDHQIVLTIIELQKLHQRLKSELPVATWLQGGGEKASDTTLSGRSLYLLHSAYLEESPEGRRSMIRSSINMLKATDVEFLNYSAYLQLGLLDLQEGNIDSSVENWASAVAVYVPLARKINFEGETILTARDFRYAYDIYHGHEVSDAVLKGAGIAQARLAGVEDGAAEQFWNMIIDSYPSEGLITDGWDPNANMFAFSSAVEFERSILDQVEEFSKKQRYYHGNDE